MLKMLKCSSGIVLIAHFIQHTKIFFFCYSSETQWRRPFFFFFFFFFFAFHFWKRRKFVLGLPKWEFYRGKNISRWENLENDFASSEKYACYAPGETKITPKIFKSHWTISVLLISFDPRIFSVTLDFNVILSVIVSYREYDIRVYHISDNKTFWLNVLIKRNVLQPADWHVIISFG